MDVSLGIKWHCSPSSFFFVLYVTTTDLLNVFGSILPPMWCLAPSKDAAGRPLCDVAFSPWTSRLQGSQNYLPFLRHLISSTFQQFWSYASSGVVQRCFEYFRLWLYQSLSWNSLIGYTPCILFKHIVFILYIGCKFAKFCCFKVLSLSPFFVFVSHCKGSEKPKHSGAKLILSTDILIPHCQILRSRPGAIA